VRLTGHHDWVEALAFTPDGRRLLSGSGATEHLARDTRILMWDLTARRPRPRTLGRLPDAVRALAVDRRGRFAASAGADGGVVVWDLRSSRAVHRFRAGTDRVFSVCFSPDGRTVVAAGRDGEVHSWTVRSGRAVLPVLRGHGESVRGMAFAAPDRLVTVGHEDARLMVWDVAPLASSRLDVPVPGTAGFTRAVAVDDAHGRVAAGSSGGTLTLVDPARPGQPIQVAAGGPVWSLAFAPDGGLLAGTVGGSVALWDARTGRAVVPPVDTHEQQEQAVAFAPDGRTFVTGGSGHVVRRWDLRLRPVGTPLAGQRNWVTALAFRPDGTLASGGADGQVWLWRPDGHGVALTTPTNQLTAVAWTPDGRYVVSGDSLGNVVRWPAPARVPDASTGPPLLEHQNAPPLGRLDGAVEALALTGPTMVTADHRGTAYLWDVDGSLPRLVGPIARRQNAYGAAVGTSGTVVVGFGDGARRMDTDVRSWRRTACVVAGRNLTRDEFAEAVRGYAYHRTCPDLPEPLRYLSSVPVAP
jgi:WD40 repeat protein